MAADRSLWRIPFSTFPQWPCPTCARGLLLKVEPSFSLQETGPSRSAHNHEAWEPDWVQKRFVGLLECNNPGCKEICAISGHSTVGYDEDVDDSGEPIQVFCEVYFPHTMTPAPRIFNWPNDCPEDIVTALDQAFQLIWVDYESSANKFRVAAESLLTDQKIPKFSPHQKGKSRRPFTLHARIELLKEKNAEAAECLMAVKWVGNHGSHNGGKLTLEDVLSSSDLFEHVLDLLYSKKAFHDPVMFSVRSNPDPEVPLNARWTASGSPAIALRYARAG